MKPIIQAKKLRLGVLASGRGSNFLAIQQAIAAGRLDAETILALKVAFSQSLSIALESSSILNISSIK